MCTGAELALIGTTLATTAAQTKFQSDAAKDVRKSKQAAQRLFNEDVDDKRKRSVLEFGNSVETAGREKTDQRIQEATVERAALNEPSFDTRTLLPGQGDASNAVKTAIVQSQDKGDAAIGEAGNRAAILSAFGDADLRKNIQLLQNSNRISTQGGFAQGALPILQAGLSDTESAGDAALRRADIAGAIGAIGSAGIGAVPGTPSAGALINAPVGSPAGFSARRVAPASVSGL